jgi:hypothetical protein
VRANRGAAGIDRQTITDIEEYGTPSSSMSWARS